MDEKTYNITVTLTVDGHCEEEALDKVYDVLDRAYNGIQQYSIDATEEV